MPMHSSSRNGSSVNLSAIREMINESQRQGYLLHSIEIDKLLEIYLVIQVHTPHRDVLLLYPSSFPILAHHYSFRISSTEMGQYPPRHLCNQVKPRLVTPRRMRNIKMNVNGGHLSL